MICRCELIRVLNPPVPLQEPNWPMACIVLCARLVLMLMLILTLILMSRELSLRLVAQRHTRAKWRGLGAERRCNRSSENTRAQLEIYCQQLS